MTLQEKLRPKRFTAMSGKMAAIVSYIVGTRWPAPSIAELIVTSDDFVLARLENDIDANEFIGSAADLRNNWLRLLDAADLTEDERKEAQLLYAAKVRVA